MFLTITERNLHGLYFSANFGKVAVTRNPLPSRDPEREPRHLRPRAEPLAGLLDAGPGERAVVGVWRPGRCDSEDHRLSGGGGGEGVEREGPDAVGHGARALLRACPRGHGRRTRASDTGGKKFGGHGSVRSAGWLESGAGIV